MDRSGPLLSDPKDPGLDFRSFSISSQNTEGFPALLVQVPVSEPTGSSSEEHSSPSSSIDSHSGFYSLVDDPSCPEAELNTAWMVSAQRQNQLATLKEERAFKLQTYSSGRRPRTLFPEEVGEGYACQQEELRARVGVVLQEEERRLRQEIIRSQAPRKKPVHAAGVNLQDLELNTGDLLDSLCSVHSGAEQLAPLVAETVDKKQINFNAARQQFLQMEQQNQQLKLRDSLRPSRTGCRTRPTQGVVSSLQQNQMQLSQHIAGPDQLELQKKVSSSRSKNLASNETTSQMRTSRPTTDHETSIKHKKQLVQERKEKLLSQCLKSSDDQVQVQVTSNHLNPVINLASSKNNWREGGILELKSVEAHQKLEGQVDDRFPSPCCPHRHSKETELLLQGTSATLLSSRVQETKSIYQDRLTSPFFHFLLLSPSSSPGSWRENLESSSLQSRGQGTPNFIQQDIEESLRREQELQELRASRIQLRPLIPDLLVKQTLEGAGTDLNPLKPTGSICPLLVRLFQHQKALIVNIELQLASINSVVSQWLRPNSGSASAVSFSRVLRQRLLTKDTPTSAK